MFRICNRGLIGTVCVLLLSSAVFAGSAKIRLKIVDEQGAVIPEALIMFQMIQDAEQQFTVEQNEAGSYAKTVKLTSDDATWSVTKVLAPGYLPVKVDLRSFSASGEAVQKVAAMDLDPANPIPPIQILGSGEVQMNLTLGDQAAVMQKFRAVRAAAREAREAEQAQQQAAAPSGAYADAVRLYNEGDFAGSVTAFQEALKERPEDQELKVSYAGALYKAQRFEEFEAAAQDALKQNPQNPNLLMMVYSSSRGRGDLQTAMDALLSVRKLGGGADLLPHLTFVAQKLGPSAKTVPAYEAILELDANNLVAVVGLANVHELAGRSKAAQGYVDRAVKLDPDGAYKLYYGLATKLLDKPNATPQSVDRAIDLLDKAVATQPDSADALRRVGMARWQREDHTRAAEALRKYLMLKPDADDRDKIAEYLNSLPQ